MTIYLKEVAFFNKQNKMVLHIRRLDLNDKSKQSMWRSINEDFGAKNATSAWKNSIDIAFS